MQEGGTNPKERAALITTHRRITGPQLTLHARGVIPGQKPVYL